MFHKYYIENVGTPLLLHYKVERVLLGVDLHLGMQF